MKRSSAYTAFIKKLHGGRYKIRNGVKAAIHYLKGLSDEERVEAGKEADKIFPGKSSGAAAPTKVPDLEPPPPQPSAVANIVGLFTEIRAKQINAISALRVACESVVLSPLSDNDLAELLALILEFAPFGTLTSFSKLMNRYGHRITPELLSISSLASSPQFWSFVNVIVGASNGNHELTSAVFERIPVEADRRSSDAQQVEAFERVITTMGSRIPLQTFGPVIVEYASPRFVFSWLQGLDEVPEDAIHQFSHRLMVLYINGDTNAEQLMTFMELEPNVQIDLRDLVERLRAQAQRD